MRHRLLVLLILVMPAVALAHGGGLNAEGCHTNRKTGDYHCHRKPAAPAPVRSAAVAPKASSTRGSVYYANCAAARAAGAAPVRVGDPGYARHLDRDGDGVGCE
jgi:hypothetical protein